MYICIKFENLESEGTQATRQLLYGVPNGTCLSSSNSQVISTRLNKSVGVWYLDIDVLNKHYGGVLNCLKTLSKYAGVVSVDVLPFEEALTSENIDDMREKLADYVEGMGAR